MKKDTSEKGLESLILMSRKPAKSGASITSLFTDDAQLFKQFQDNESFRRWLTDTVFGMTYEE